MFTHDGLRLPGNGANLRRRTPGLLSRLLTAGVAIVLLVGALALSLFVIAAGALAAAVAGSYLWWKTRELRRRLREQPRGGRIIEGEVIRDDSPR
jgi:O-antigen/teichoic acid export membrane protein